MKSWESCGSELFILPDKPESCLDWHFSSVAPLMNHSTTLWQSIVDNGVLEAVRQWLEPINPSGALPAVGIQKAIFEVLPRVRLHVDATLLC